MDPRKRKEGARDGIIEMSSVSRSHWMRYAASEKQSLGELFDQRRDITANRHKGNLQSTAAFNAIKDRLTVQQERVFRCIKDGGERGRTNEDICGVLGLTPNQVSPRLTELHVAGRITKIGTRLTKSKCSAGVWKVT